MKKCPFKKIIIDRVGESDRFGWCDKEDCMAYCLESEICMLIQKKSEFNFMN